MLKKLEELGAEVVGIELDEKYSKFSRNLGQKVFSDPLEKLDFSGEFDVVVSFHTLEHVYSPKETITAIFKAIKPSGFFLGEVPNQHDWRIQIFDNEVAK